MSTGPSRCRQSRPDVDRAVQSCQGRLDLNRAVWISTGPSGSQQGRLACAEDGRDVPRTGETCRGRERRAEDGRDVPRSAETWQDRQKRGDVGRGMARSEEEWRGRQRDQGAGNVSRTQRKARASQMSSGPS